MANTAAAGGPDALAGAETLHAKIAGEAMEISARRSKEQAVAGREYRSHLLRRIDPASSLNLSRAQSQVDGTELVKGFLSDGMVCDPQEMDDLIKNNRVHVLQSAVVLM